VKPNMTGVVLVDVSSPGYQWLALDYLHAAAKADARLADVPIARLAADTTTDPWWIAYRILGLHPAPAVVAFSVVCWNARAVYEAVRVIKQARPDLLVVLGGPEVGPIAEDVLERQPSVDAIVRGEGEVAFCDLLHAVSRGGDIAAVPGVTARVDGTVVAGPDREPAADLDALASPYGVASPVAIDGSAFIETYRGCPHRCAYCYEGKGSTRIRSFSWDRIADDIEKVASTPGMRAFSFIDPVFNLTPDRLRRLSDMLAPWAARGIALHTIEVDIERIDDEAAALLRQAGVASVETGPQTVGARALDACARDFDPDRFRAGVDACKREGISVECDLIVGLPGDTMNDVLDGIDFALSLDPGKVQLSTLHVLPGTDLWSRASELRLVFDPEPPHELIATADLAFADLRRLEELGHAATAIYRARVAPRKDRS